MLEEDGTMTATIRLKDDLYVVEVRDWLSEGMWGTLQYA